MRILRILTRLNLGGPARQALAGDPLLVEKGHSVRTLAGVPEPGEGDLLEQFQARGLDVVRVPGLRRGLAPVGDFRAWAQIRRELKRFRPDVLHTHAFKAGLLGRLGIPRAAAVRRVHTFHGHVLEGYFSAAMSGALIRLERRLACSTDRVVAVSHATADDLVRLGVVPEEQLTVVYPGSDLAPLSLIARRSNHLRRLLGVSDEAFLVGVVGRLAPVKQPELAVEVFELLERRYPQLELVFVGDGQLRGALERRIEGGSEAVSKRVHMAGMQPNMPAVMADLDAVLLTSRSEGMPVSLIEYPSWWPMSAQASWGRTSRS